MLELNTSDCPMTKEEALSFDERLEQGSITMLYGSNECSYDESNQWYVGDITQKQKLIQEGQ